MDEQVDGIEALERSYEQLATVVAGVRDDAWTAPTGCPAWDGRALLDHVLGHALMNVAVNAGEPAGEDAGAVSGDDPVGAVRRVATENLRSWRAPHALEGERTYPWGTFPAHGGLIVNVGEVAVHTWDLAQATGQQLAIDPATAQMVFDLYSRFPMDGMRAEGVYGPEIPVPDDAPVDERLLGLFSRTPTASARRP